MGNRLGSSRIENVAQTCLIWLDANVNSEDENIIAQKHFRRSFRTLLTFDNEKQYLEHIRLMSNNDKAILIVSGRFGRIIVPKIAKLKQIISIYVYCLDREGNKQWAQRYSKVTDIVDSLDYFFDRFRIERNLRKLEKIDIETEINLFDSKNYHPEQSTTKLNGQFMYNLLLIDCLIRMERSADEREKFIDFFKKEYQNNPKELKILKKFQSNYSPEEAMNWYTKNTFIFQRLNRALRVQDANLLYLYRFFIRDLEKQLEEHRCPSSVRVYRGQYLSTEELNMLKTFINQFISMNSFLSTSLNLTEARKFLLEDQHETREKIILQIDADPGLKDIKAFSNIADYSEYGHEQEILFMPGSIFRIVHVNLDDDNIWKIHLRLSSNTDQQLQSLFEYMRNQLGTGETNLYCFAGILQDMGKLDDAEKYYKYYLKKLPDNHPHVSACYHALGIVTAEKKDYELSLTWYNKLLDVDTRENIHDNANTANIHNSMGIAFHGMGNHVKAIQSYEKALRIWRSHYGDEHEDIAMCLDNIANVYQAQKKYLKALNYHKQALQIRQKYLPTNHFDIGISHTNIGTAYGRLNSNNLAVKHYECALEIFEKSLDSSHHYMSTAMENIASIYEQQANYEKAQFYYKKIVKIFHQTLPANDSNIVRIEQRIDRVSSKIANDCF